MRGNKENKPLVLVYRIVAGLICAVLITSGLVARHFAKYTANSSTSDYARIAKFDVMGDGVFTKPIQIALAPSSEKQLIADIEINNNCEVAVECSVVINNQYHNIPLQFELRQKVGSDFVDGNGTMSFDYSPGSDKDISYGLFMYLPEDENTPDSNLKYRGMVDYLTVTVTATQVD